MLCPGLAAYFFAAAALISAYPQRSFSHQRLRQTSFFFAFALPLAPHSASAYLFFALPLQSSRFFALPLRGVSELFLRQSPLFFAFAFRYCSAQSRRISLPSISSPCRCPADRCSSLPCHCTDLPRISFATPCQSGQSLCESRQYSAVAPDHLYRQGSSRPFCPGYTVCRMQIAPSSLISRYR